ncbi:MAG: tRNA (guanosine(46)-N7)-methyltransferase TrmB [Pseudomonadota bacterium]
MKETALPKPAPLRTFGRRGGRALSARQKTLIDDVLPRLRVPVSDGVQSDPASLFPGGEALWLEIGFGGGEHTVAQAAANPAVGVIGCEVFYEGLAKCLSQIESTGLSNIRLWDEDARVLVSHLADASIGRAFILFPDPWPKAKHHKRRLIQTDFLDDLARVVEPGGQVRFATDVRSYADEALTRFLAHPRFDWTASGPDDWRRAPPDHMPTRYEAKRLGDIAPVYFDFSVTSLS